MRGECSECNNVDIDYGDTTLQSESMRYRYICNGCGHTGIEWYDLVYSETT